MNVKFNILVVMWSVENNDEAIFKVLLYILF